jgi:hypothetical protein
MYEVIACLEGQFSNIDVSKFDLANVHTHHIFVKALCVAKQSTPLDVLVHYSSTCVCNVLVTFHAVSISPSRVVCP